MIKDFLNRWFVHNWKWKCLSLVLAAFLWLFVVNYDNPVITRTFTGIPIELVNEDTLIDNNMIYSVVGPQTATVRVKCARKLAESLRVTDFKATADFNDLYSLTNQVPIVVTCSNARVTSDEIIQQTLSLEIELEEIQSRQVEVRAVVSGEPASGFRVGEISCSPNTVTVSAPQSVLDQISFAGVAVNVDGLSQTMTRTMPLQFYNAGGNVMDLTSESYLTSSTSEIGVEVEILNVKTVNIDYEVTGQDQVADGYMYAGIEVDPATVQISGRKTVLADISSLDIPEGELDVSDASENITRTFDLRDLLPDGVTLVDLDDYTLTVTLKIEKLAVKEFTLSSTQLEFLNLREDLVANIVEQEIPVVVRGLESDLDNLSVSEITGTLDVSGMRSGSHLVNAEITVPRGFQVVTAPRVVVRLESASEAESEAETTAALSNAGTQSAAQGDPAETSAVPEITASEDDTAAAGTLE